jgi:hypothetical protein
MAARLHEEPAEVAQARAAADENLSAALLRKASSGRR